MTQSELKKLLSYNPDTGVFTCITPTSKRINIGDVAGSEGQGWILITINKKPYRANRLAWLYMTGEWPSHDVKCINGITDDVRWNNLKLGTRER